MYLERQTEVCRLKEFTKSWAEEERQEKRKAKWNKIKAETVWFQTLWEKTNVHKEKNKSHSKVQKITMAYDFLPVILEHREHWTIIKIMKKSFYPRFYRNKSYEFIKRIRWRHFHTCKDPKTLPTNKKEHLAQETIRSNTPSKCGGKKILKSQK